MVHAYLVDEPERGCFQAEDGTNPHGGRKIIRADLAEFLLDKLDFDPWCPIPEIAEIAALGRTPARLAHRAARPPRPPDVTNRPTENLNLKIKNTRRIARGYRNLDHYRLPLLLNHGRMHKDHPPTRIRTHRLRFAA